MNAKQIGLAALVSVTMVGDINAESFNQPKHVMEVVEEDNRFADQKGKVFVRMWSQGYIIISNFDRDSPHRWTRTQTFTYCRNPPQVTASEFGLSTSGGHFTPATMTSFTDDKADGTLDEAVDYQEGSTIKMYKKDAVTKSSAGASLQDMFDYLRKDLNVPLWHQVWLSKYGEKK